MDVVRLRTERMHEGSRSQVLGPAAMFGKSENGRSLAAELEELCRCWNVLDGKSRLFLTRDGQVLAADESCERLFEKSCGLSLSDGALRASAQACESLSRVLGVGEGPITIVLPQDGRDGHLILRATSYKPGIVCVIIHEADGSAPVRFASLSDAFGLTPAEERVLIALLNGHSGVQVADELGLSVNTVRTHIRHCHDKLGVSSRAELWKAVSPYRID